MIRKVLLFLTLFVWVNLLYAEVINDSTKEDNKSVSIAYFYYKNGTPYFLSLDHLGNTRAVVTNNTIEAQYDYYPYGKILRKWENVSSRYLSTGHEQDAETGYNARNARWQDADMLGFGQVDPHSDNYPFVSPYNYCMGNPILITDPTGEDPDKDREGERGERVKHSDGNYYIMTEKGWGGTPQEDIMIKRQREKTFYQGNADVTTSLIDGSSCLISQGDIVHFGADVGMSFGYNSLMRTSLYLDKLSSMADDIGRGVLTSRTEVAMGRFNAMIETRAALDPIGRMLSGGLKSEQTALDQANRFINSNRPLMDAVKTRGWVNHLARFGKYGGPALTIGAYGFQTYGIIQNPAVENVKDMNNSIFNPGFWIYQNVFEPYILMPMFPKLKLDK